jgi:hypothetical protein
VRSSYLETQIGALLFVMAGLVPAIRVFFVVRL